jgi:hypothetical protein
MSDSPAWIRDAIRGSDSGETIGGIDVVEMQTSVPGITGVSPQRSAGAFGLPCRTNCN